MSNQFEGNPDEKPASGVQNISYAWLASLCDKACSEVTSWHAVGDEFRRQCTLQMESTSDLIATIGNSNEVLNAFDAIVIAFQYTLRVGAGKVDIRDAFLPMAVFEDGSQIPPRIAELPPVVIETWTGMSPHLTHPSARSRIEDLLFVQGASNTGLHLRSSIDSYLELVNSNWTLLEISHSLLRANQLARATKDPERIDLGVSRIISYCSKNLESGAPPGITVPLLESLIESDRSNNQINGLIATARAAYQEPHIADQLIYWQIRRSKNKKERQSYARERVQLWIDAATTADPLIRVMYLETAARYVDDVNDVELKHQIARLLQAAGREDLNLKRMTSELNLPQEAVDRYLAQFTEPESWQEALDRFSRYPPPTGSYEENVRMADQVDATAPLQALIPHVRLGGDGLPRWRPITEEDQADARLARQEELQALVVGGLLAQGLSEIGKNYSRPERSSLVDYFSLRPDMVPEIATQLATAVDLYWSGEEDAAGHIAIWLIEPLLRNLLLHANEGLYSVQRHQRPGQYPGMSFLLKELRKLGLDISWYRYLWTVFASPAGLNLRNEAAHGFAVRFDPTIAVLAIHASCFLSTIRVIRGND